MLRGSRRWGGTWALLRLLGTQRMVRPRGVSWVELPTEEGTGRGGKGALLSGEGERVLSGEEVWGCLLSKKDLKRGERVQRAGCWQRVKGAQTRGPPTTGQAPGGGCQGLGGSGNQSALGCQHGPLPSL